MLLGVALRIPLDTTYIASGLEFERADTMANHLTMTGLAAVIVGAQLFVLTFALGGRLSQRIIAVAVPPFATR